jgi:copper ion binding protein
MVEKTYVVPGISCDHCRRAIEKALAELDGVEQVTVDVVGKSVAVSLDESVRDEAVKARLAEEGYPVEE